MKKSIAIGVIVAGIIFGITLYVGIQIGNSIDVKQNLQENQIKRIEEMEMKRRGRK